MGSLVDWLVFVCGFLGSFFDFMFGSFMTLKKILTVIVKMFAK